MERVKSEAAERVLLTFSDAALAAMRSVCNRTRVVEFLEIMTEVTVDIILEFG